MERCAQLTRHVLGPFAQNCYVWVGPSGKRAALVDPGLDSEGLIDLLVEQGLELEWIVNTHGHLDHSAGNRFFKERTGAPLIIHEADAPMLDQLSAQGRMFGLEVADSPPPDAHFVEGRPFRFDGLEVDVIHTPGHSPGGVCLHWDDHLLVGDTLFQGSVGRTDLPGGNTDQLIRSIRRKLFLLPPQTICHPGHGEETTLGRERAENPFVSDRALGLRSPELS